MLFGRRETQWVVKVTDKWGAKRKGILFSRREDG